MSHNTDEAATQYTSTAGLPPRERAELLAAERRRLVLDFFTEQATAVELDELATEVAAQEKGGQLAL